MHQSLTGRSLWLDYSQRQAWEGWLAKLPPEKRDVYFLPEYARLYVSSDAEAACYVYSSGERVFLYPFLLRGVPFIPGVFDIATPYGYGGPIANTDDPDFIAEACRRFRDEASQRGVVAELIKFHPLLGNHLPLQPSYPGRIQRERSTVYAEMAVEEPRRWQEIYSHANRKNINKAKRGGIEVRFGQDEEAWRAFRTLYADTMADNKADPFYLFSADYFDRVRRDLANHYVLVSCVLEGRTISVLLALLGLVHAHCHLIGTDRALLNTGANNLLHHELILWCKARGYEKLHIGGGRSGADDDPLLRFKRNFSDKTSSFFVAEHVLDEEVYADLCARWKLQHPSTEASHHLLRYRLT